MSQEQDYELLKLAALAGGISYDDAASRPSIPPRKCWFGLWLRYDREPTELDRRYWNPLTDDGQALRLAGDLRLTVSMPDHECEVWTEGGDCLDSTSLHGRVGPHRQALIRRAIVCAAAEIGRQSKPRATE